MDSLLTETVVEELKKLPQQIQDLITKSGWEQSVRKIVDKHNLRVDQGADLETETLLIMLGLSSTEDFLSNIKDQTDIPDALAREIVGEIDRNIFEKLHATLRELTDEGVDVSNFGQVIDDDMLDRNDVLKGIEDPEDTQSAPETPSYSLNTNHKESPAPSNLPTGSISDVPLHGHNHNTIPAPSQQNVNVPPVIPQPSPQHPIMDKKLEGGTQTKAEQQSYGNGSQAKRQPPKRDYDADPYREPV